MSHFDCRLLKVVVTNYYFISGPLQYMSSRLIWLQDVADKMVISDLNGNNTYQLNSPKQQRVSWFLPTLFPIRRGKNFAT